MRIEDKEPLSPYADRPVSDTNPSYYRSHPSGVECIDIIRSMPFSQGNAIKYTWRLGEKDASDKELRKALWYAQDCLDSGEYVRAWSQPWATDKWVGNVLKWSAAEQSGYRKSYITAMLHGYITGAIKVLNEWIETNKMTGTQS